MGATKKVIYTKSGIDKLPDDKPVVYKILTESGNNNYTGIAKRGRVRDRIAEHLNEIPGSSVVIEQFSRIDDAEKKESNIIKRTQPKYNKAGK
jgi:hypothetical protein